MRRQRILIEPLPGPGTQRYRASLDGGLLVERAEEPILDACRVLIARGITGPAEAGASAPLTLRRGSTSNGAPGGS